MENEVGDGPPRDDSTPCVGANYFLCECSTIPSSASLRWTMLFKAACLAASIDGRELGIQAFVSPR